MLNTVFNQFLGYAKMVFFSSFRCFLVVPFLFLFSNWLGHSYACLLRALADSLAEFFQPPPTQASSCVYPLRVIVHGWLLPFCGIRLDACFLLLFFRNALYVACLTTLRTSPLPAYVRIYFPCFVFCLSRFLSSFFLITPSITFSCFFPRICALVWFPGWHAV